ncbi:MAG: ribonuclease HII [Clostridia bacterium]|nr:ribonuclease HII [Clostridia bacterium]
MEIIDKLQYEKEFLKKGYTLIGGVDEVGRGPLAGPVVCACVVMPLDDIIEGVDDSKKLSKKKREALYDLITKKAISYSIQKVEPEVIDEVNILNATKLCMKNAIETLSIKPEVVLIDAVKIETSVETFSIIKGDLKSYSIGCASIIAKVYRDRLMEDYAKIYPQYGFEKHSGYGTKQHIAAIKEIGACPIHRKTFIKNFLA